MSKRLSHVILRLLPLLAICFCSNSILRASDLSDLQTKLKSEYCGRVVTLRSFLPGDQLEFNPLGDPLTRSEADSWTTSGEINLTEIHLKDDQLQFLGKRVFLVSKGGNNFESLFTVPGLVGSGIQIANPRKKKFKKLEKLRPVTITIHLQPQMSEDAIRSAIHKVFLGGDENLSDVAPPYWKLLLSTPGFNDPSVRMKDVLRVGGRITPPHALYAPNPEYSEVARQAQLQGTVLVWLVVDSAGLPRNIRLVRAIGLGLDDKAARAVSQWKFDPAKKDLVPVEVQINVEVTFKLY